VPKKVHIFSKDRYFVALFEAQKAKKELFQESLYDKYFDGFFVENLKSGSRIIIKTKKGYTPEFDNTSNKIVVRAKLIKRKIKKPSIKKSVPETFAAMPFYISDRVFIKKRSQTEASYDETLFFTGVKMFANKNYSMAAEFFKEIIKKYPNSKFYISSQFLLGDCYNGEKEYAKAIQVYNQAIKLSSKNTTVAQTLLNIADIWVERKYYSKARDIYKSVMKDYASSRWGYEAQFLLAKTYYEQGRFKKAEEMFVGIDKKSEFYSTAFLLAAECFIKEKDDARAVLAYYSASKRLDSINTVKYYKELTDVALALCRFNDYKAASNIFDKLEKEKVQDITEESYLGRMECDLSKGDYEDLNNRAELIIHSSKNKERIKRAQKLLDKSKLKSGKLNQKGIEKILKKYKDQPDIASLALYVYAKKSYRNKHFKTAIDYLIKLKKLYPASKYLKESKPMAKDSINMLLNDLYTSPSKQALDYIYDAVITLNRYDADMCRLSIAMIAFNSIENLSKILPYAKNKNCKKALYAKYYIERGYDKNALEALDDVDKVKPYIYYVDMVMGDINYFKGAYDSAASFYRKALSIDISMLKDYVKIKLADALLLSNNYKDSLKYLNVSLKIYKNRILYIKGMDYYNLKNYKESIINFKQLSNILEYKEKALFYIAISYIKLKDMKNAKVYFNKLKLKYPKSNYLRTLKVLME
jgi:TolA-binding protein